MVSSLVSVHACTMSVAEVDGLIPKITGIRGIVLGNTNAYTFCGRRHDHWERCTSPASSNLHSDVSMMSIESPTGMTNVRTC